MKKQEYQEEPQYYTVSEVANEFRIDASTIRRWIKSERLQAVNLAKARSARATWRIPASEIARLSELD